MRNHGCVDLMEEAPGCDSSGNTHRIAVKKMPNKWMRNSAKEFKSKYPSATERPWYDMAFVKSLNSMGFTHVCKLIDIFRDEKHSYVAIEFCTEGDLFAWSDRESSPGSKRETAMRPLVSPPHLPILNFGN